jgi:class 3 adenylate cyclase
VLYADILGFEHFLPQLDTKLLVDSLDEIFIKLQQIVAKFAVKNIRTIGDTLMCIGGIPKKNITNTIEVLLAAVEMQYYINDLQRSSETGKIWKFRIGIHTGTVVASITGKKRPQYDVKGDTVNLAARIRQFCEDGNILISATTYELVKDLFLCEYFNKMPVKYQGEIPLYTVKSIKPEFSLQGKGIIPNKRFSIRYGLIQFTDLQEIILDKLEKELPQSLYYHNVKHTVDVVTQVELIGLGEGVTDEDLLLLKTAALFHDIGHTISYDNHEYFSCLVAREILPEYYYTTSQIDTICELIIATKLPPKPQNKLEEIMCDADLDYLGRSDMIPVSNTLFLELKERSMIKSLNDWNTLQMKFISGHQYFTETARNLREVNKQMQIERIRNLIVEE